MKGEDFIKKAYESILSNDFEQAIDHFERAIALEPANASYHFKLSVSYARSNRLQKALEHAELAIELDLERQEYRAHHQHVQAKLWMQSAEKALQQDPALPHEAVFDLNRAIELDPLSIEAYLLLGISYSELGDFFQAIQAIREALKLDPQHAAANKLMNDYQTKLKAFLHL